MAPIFKKVFSALFFLAIAMVIGIALPHQALASASTTSFTLTAVSGTYGGTVTVRAMLRASSTPIVGRTVTFKLAGMTLAAATTTDSSGFATWHNVNIYPIDAGTYATGFTASSTADGHYHGTASSTSLTISAAPLTVSGVTASNKVYDKTLTATINAKSAVLVGIINGDGVTLATTSTGTFATRGVDTGIAVTVTPFTLGNGTATSSNYSLTQPIPTANITAKPLTITGITVANRAYNGTSTAALGGHNTALVGAVSGDTITFATTSMIGAFANKNVGAAKTVSITGITFSTATNTNYSLTQPSTTATITPVSITVTAAANTKAYDTLTTAAGVPTVTSGSLISGDTGTFTETYDDKTVGTSHVLTPAGTIADALSANMTGNYTITFATISTGAITAVTLVGSITASNKTYDGTTAATIASRSLSGVLGSDVVSYSGGTATFSDPNVANSKKVTATGLSLAGTDAGNYSVNSTATTTANITSSGSGSVGGVSYCSSVVYGDWKTCAAGYQSRDILSQSPNYCSLTAAQQAARTKVCGAANPIIPSTPIVTTPTVPTGNVLDNIANEAGIVSANNAGSLQAYLSVAANPTAEAASLIKYKAVLGQDSKITAAEKTAINDFIVYGTPTTLRLGAGERAGVVNSYFQAFGKLPNSEAEWSDVIKIANGRWPGELNQAAENIAKAQFKKVYGRNSAVTNGFDQNAVTVMAYGLIPSLRNLASEKVAIQTFRYYYGHSPVSALAWNIVRAIAYSGATR
ncbi:MAG: YDG domain-containing protein [Patescibacteria group bacterium]|nr:YDG domain-containing protein [Patescibacteria group bacterium]